MNPVIKNTVKIVAVILILAGGVWILQGLNILPGSYMSGNPQWVVNGSIIALFGAGIFWFVYRKI